MATRRELLDALAVGAATLGYRSTTGTTCWKPGVTLGGGRDSLDRKAAHTCELREWVSEEPSFFGTLIRAIFLERLRSI
jgi:hypothetical protein